MNNVESPTGSYLDLLCQIRDLIDLAGNLRHLGNLRRLEHRAQHHPMSNQFYLRLKKFVRSPVVFRYIECQIRRPLVVLEPLPSPRKLVPKAGKPARHQLMPKQVPATWPPPIDCRYDRSPIVRHRSPAPVFPASALTPRPSVVVRTLVKTSLCCPRPITHGRLLALCIPPRCSFCNPHIKRHNRRRAGAAGRPISTSSLRVRATSGFRVPNFLAFSAPRGSNCVSWPPTMKAGKNASSASTRPLLGRVRRIGRDAANFSIDPKHIRR